MAFKVGTTENPTGEVIIDDNSAGHFQNPAIAWKYRVIITYAYVYGGYIGSTPWKDVGKVVAATDQTTHLGSLLDKGAMYTAGVSNQTSTFIIGTKDDYVGPLGDGSSHTTAFNMYNDSLLAHSANHDPIYDTNDTGIIFQETYFAWICGGHILGSSAWGSPTFADAAGLNLTNETMQSGRLSGTVTWDGTHWQGSVYAVSDETQGHIGFSNYEGLDTTGTGWGRVVPQTNVTDQTVVYATETVLNTSNNICFCPHQHGISTKEHKAYGSNEGDYASGWNLRVWDLTTMTQTDTVQKPWYVQQGNSENNFTMGQDHQYMLGCHGDNGAGSSVQQNTSWRLNHSTDTGPVDPSGLKPGWQDGMASGATGWRA
tara:strand:- start:8224 stop:9336 length:1113 start_codon:yes stop_codon:yes gene_type:complete